MALVPRPLSHPGLSCCRPCSLSPRPVAGFNAPFYRTAVPSHVLSKSFRLPNANVGPPRRLLSATSQSLTTSRSGTRLLTILDPPASTAPWWNPTGHFFRSQVAKARTNGKMRKWEMMVENAGGAAALLEPGDPTPRFSNKGPVNSGYLVLKCYPKEEYTPIGIRFPDHWTREQAKASTKWLERQFFLEGGNLASVLDKWAELCDRDDLFFSMDDSRNAATSGGSALANAHDASIDAPRSTSRQVHVATPSPVTPPQVAKHVESMKGESLTNQILRLERRGKLKKWLDMDSAYKQRGGYTHDTPQQCGRFSRIRDIYLSKQGEVKIHDFLCMRNSVEERLRGTAIAFPASWDRSELSSSIKWLNEETNRVRDVRQALENWAKLADQEDRVFSSKRERGKVESIPDLSGTRTVRVGASHVALPARPYPNYNSQTLRNKLVHARYRIHRLDTMITNFGGRAALRKLPLDHMLFGLNTPRAGLAKDGGYLSLCLRDTDGSVREQRQVGIRMPDHWDSAECHRSLEWLNRQVVARDWDIHAALSDWAEFGDRGANMFANQAAERVGSAGDFVEPTTKLDGSEKSDPIAFKAIRGEAAMPKDSLLQQVRTAERNEKMNIWLNMELEYKKKGGYTTALPLRPTPFLRDRVRRSILKVGGEPSPTRLWLKLAFLRGEIRRSIGISLPSTWDEGEVGYSMDWLNKRLVETCDVREALLDWAKVADRGADRTFTLLSGPGVADPEAGK